MICKWDENGVCKNCGEPATYALPFYRQCPAGKKPTVEGVRRRDGQPKELSPELKAAVKAAGLGDYTQQVLHGMGITQDRYVAVKELFGLAPTCNCAGRKAWLNKVSDWWRGERSS